MNMGGELRKLASKDTPSGREVRAIIDSGRLVPYTLSKSITEKFVAATAPDQRIIFDGYPRTIEQAADFKEVMEKNQRDAVLISIDLPVEVALRRLSARAQTGERADDATETAIRSRIEIFHKEAQPLKDQFKTWNKYIEIDGDGTVEEVQQRILTAIGE